MKYYTNKYYYYKYMIELTDKESNVVGLYDNEWELAEKQNLDVKGVKIVLGRVRKAYKRWGYSFFWKKLNCYVNLICMY